MTIEEEIRWRAARMDRTETLAEWDAEWLLWAKALASRDAGLENQDKSLDKRPC